MITSKNNYSQVKYSCRLPLISVYYLTKKPLLIPGWKKWKRHGYKKIGTIYNTHILNV